MDIKDENDKLMKTMYRNLKRLRQSSALSIEQLSEVSGIDKCTLAGIENGEDFDVLCLFKLCDVYKIKPHEIFCEK